MHTHLNQIWTRLSDASAMFSSNEQFDQYWGLLYGDHVPKTPDPYVIRKLGPVVDLISLVDDMRAEPLCSGGDKAEALEDAMRACAEFASGISRPVCFVILTDAPPHPSTECPSGIDFGEEVSRILRNGNHCFVASDWIESEARDCWEPLQSDERFGWLRLDQLPDLVGILDERSKSELNRR